ncbi:MAG: hypothetical protein LBG92_05825 [Prevotellaceae bacterium]|nr:hypothetical protein [Prevotellaceae bacterium]
MILVCLVDSFNDTFYEKAEWNFSVFKGLPDFISWKVSLAISLFLIMLAAALLYKIDEIHFGIKSKSHQITGLWVIQIAGFPFLHSLTEVHVAIIFILLSYDKLFSINNKSNEAGDVFISTMYLGIATIFYSCTAYLLIPHIIAIYRFRYATVRDWIVSLAGFLTPFYFSIFISYFVLGDCLYPVKVTLANLMPHFLSNSLDLSAIQYVSCAYITFLIIIKGIVISNKSLGGMNQKTMSCNLIFSTMLLFATSIFILFGAEGKLMLPVIFIYTTSGIKILFGTIRKKFVANLLFTIMAIISLFAFLYES